MPPGPKAVQPSASASQDHRDLAPPIGPRHEWPRVRRRLLPTVTSIACAATLATLAPSALAEPQFSVGVIPGVSGSGAGGAYWQSTRLYGGLHGDLLLGRSRAGDWGVGPFSDVATVGFDDLRLASGASVLVPVSRSWPLVLSAGAYGRKSRLGWEPGVVTWAFFGLP